jgi:urease accessory protein UreE
VLQVVRLVVFVARHQRTGRGFFFLRLCFAVGNRHISVGTDAGAFAFHLRQSKGVLVVQLNDLNVTVPVFQVKPALQQDAEQAGCPA